MDPDFYSVQEFVDGFGNDTSTVICFKTEAEAKQYLANIGFDGGKRYRQYGDFKIVPQWFGKDYKEEFND